MSALLTRLAMLGESGGALLTLEFDLDGVAGIAVGIFFRLRPVRWLVTGTMG